MKNTAKSKPIFFLFVILLFITGCNFQVNPPQNFIVNNETFFGAQRSFYVTTYCSAGIGTNTFITATSAADTDHLAVFIDNSIFKTLKPKAEEIANEFEAHYADMIGTYGPLSDVDHNGKLIVLFYPLQPITGGAYIAGYFSSRDLYIAAQSNKAELIYVNSNALKPSSSIEGIMDTVFHETQHAINANRGISEGRGSHLWLNEALSESTYFVYKNKVNGGRLGSYNYDNDIKNGDYFYTWSGKIASYATASMFMYWLYVQGNGNEILKNIASAKYLNYEAVTDAATAAGIAEGSSWNTLFETWLAANAKNDPTGVYGYNGKISAAGITARQAATGTKNLSPGDAVYTAVTVSPPLGLNGKLIDTKDGKSWKVIYNPSTDGSGSVSIDLSKEDVPEAQSLSARNAADSGPLYVPVDIVFPFEP